MFGFYRERTLQISPTNLILIFLGIIPSRCPKLYSFRQYSFSLTIHRIVVSVWYQMQQVSFPNRVFVSLIVIFCDYSW